MDDEGRPILSEKPETEANFYLELNYGETKPRLVYRNNERLIATMDNDSNQYFDTETSMWKISIHKRDQSIHQIDSIIKQNSSIQWKIFLSLNK